MPSITDFTADVTLGLAPLTVQFTDLSSPVPTGWSWNFGDSNTSAQQNPLHIYTDPGTYTVTLTITSPSGYSVETKTRYIVVNGPGSYRVSVQGGQVVYSAADLNDSVSLNVNGIANIRDTLYVGDNLNEPGLITSAVGQNLLLRAGTGGTLQLNADGTLFLNNISWPENDGTTGQVLTTDGAGVLSFQSADVALFTSTDPGIVPGSGGGTVNFLCANGTWVPAATFNSVAEPVSVIVNRPLISGLGSGFVGNQIIDDYLCNGTTLTSYGNEVFELPKVILGVRPDVTFILPYLTPDLGRFGLSYYVKGEVLSGNTPTNITSYVPNPLDNQNILIVDGVYTNTFTIQDTKLYIIMLVQADGPGGQAGGPGLYWEIKEIGGSGGGGTVTSIAAASTNAAISITGSPITTNGTLSITANTFTQTTPGIVPETNTSESFRILTSGGNWNYPGTIPTNSAIYLTSGPTITLPLFNTSVFTITLTDDTVFDFSGGFEGQRVIINFVQDSVGGRVPTFVGLTFGNQLTPVDLVFSSAPGSVDILELLNIPSQNKLAAVMFVSGY